MRAMEKAGQTFSTVLGREITPIQVGDIVLTTNLLVAPIAGYTDLSFRLMARGLGGVGLACTDLLSPQAVLRQNQRTQVLMQTCTEDTPLCVQLFGADDGPMIEAAQWCQANGTKIIDINMGCPVEKVTRCNGGSGLLCDPQRTVRMMEKLVAAVPKVAVTAKLRLGWDDTRIVAPQLARSLEEVGVRLITIHGRTTEMLFGGKVRLEGIAQVVAAVKKIPVVGNGDVRTPMDAAAMMKQTGCAGVMIGRGALSAPWLFRDTWSYLTTGTIPPRLALEEKCQILRDHFALIVKMRGEWPAVCEFRQRVTWYAKQMNPARPLREGMRMMRTGEDFERVIREFLAWRKTPEAQMAERGHPEPYA